MADIFEFTIPTPNLTLGTDRVDSAVIDVTSRLGRHGAIGVEVVPGEGADPAWFGTPDPVEFDLPTGETSRTTIPIAVPSDAAAGEYSFEVRAYAVDDPQRDFTTSPSFTLTVPESDPRPGIPLWLIILIAVLVVIVLGLAVYFLFFSGDDDPTETADTVATTEAPTTTAAPTTTTSTTTTPTTTSQPPVINPILGILSDCLEYDTANLAIKKVSAGFQVDDGSQIITTMDSEQDAKRVFVVASRHTHQCFIGRGNDRGTERLTYIVRFWAGDTGVTDEPDDPDCLEYDPDDLETVDEGASGFLLTDGRSRMLVLDNEDDAKMAFLAASEFNAHCFVGRGTSRVLEYWR